MRGRLACSVLVVLAAAGCSEPPVKERQQAEAAVVAARTAGAETYDAEDLQAAEASLKRYDEAVAQRDYRQALNEALEARERADTATKQANSKRAELRSQADALTGQLEALARAASVRLTSTTGRPSGAAADRLRNALRGAQTALQEARSRRAADDYPGAVAALTRGIEPLRRELPATEPSPARRKK